MIKLTIETVFYSKFSFLLFMKCQYEYELINTFQK